MGLIGSIFGNKSQIESLKREIEQCQRNIKKAQQDIKNGYNKERLKKQIASDRQKIKNRRENIKKLRVAIDIMFWAESAASGLAGVFGIIAFFIGYALSVEVTIAPRDFWVNSAFGIFIKKLGVANMTAFAVWFIGNLIIG